MLKCSEKFRFIKLHAVLIIHLLLTIQGLCIAGDKLYMGKQDQAVRKRSLNHLRLILRWMEKSERLKKLQEVMDILYV